MTNGLFNIGKELTTSKSGRSILTFIYRLNTQKKLLSIEVNVIGRSNVFFIYIEIFLHLLEVKLLLIPKSDCSNMVWSEMQNVKLT